MADDLVIGRINFLSNEPLQVSQGGLPFNKAHLDARAAEITRLEAALRTAADLIEQQAASLAAKDKEIERLRQEGLVKDSAIIEAAKLAKKLMTRAVQAEKEHTDMTWQRRRADERAEQAERALAVLAPVRDMLILCDELGGIQPGEGMAGYLRRLIDGVIDGQRALAEAVEVMNPFADLSQRYDDTVSDGWVSWFEFITDHAWPSETECKSARAFVAHR